MKGRLREAAGIPTSAVAERIYLADTNNASLCES
jgi:hypothetical protein